MRQTVAARYGGSAPAVDDVSFGVHDRDLVAPAGQGDLAGVAVQADLAEGGAVFVLGRSGRPDAFDEFVPVQGRVGELEFDRPAGREDARAFDGLRERFGLQ